MPASDDRPAGESVEELREPGPGQQVFIIHPPRRRYWLHALLFLATVFTTLVVGARLESNFRNSLPAFSIDQGLFALGWVLERPRRLLLGLPFSASLMLILLAHEMGHFAACVRYRVYATLPYFLPAPTLIGTLGAFIRIRSPIGSRGALFDIGIAGPIAGFLVAAPALAVGMWLSRIAPELANASDLQFGYPPVFYLLWRWLPFSGLRAAASLHDIYFHPIAVAAWVGMFATALNLLPGGQLDGGHIIYALWPRAHRRVTGATALLLALMSPFLWTGWLLWAAVLLTFGGRHPMVPRSPGVGKTRRWLAVAGLLIFILTFMPAPFLGGAMDWHETVRSLRTLMQRAR